MYIDIILLGIDSRLFLIDPHYKTSLINAHAYPNKKCCWHLKLEDEGKE